MNLVSNINHPKNHLDRISTSEICPDYATFWIMTNEWWEKNTPTPLPLVLFCFDFTLTGTSGKPNEQHLSACEAESVWYFYQCVWGHGCVFACERPSEWESQALLGLTAASWCCSRKSCWTCSCLLAASLCVSLCVSLPRRATLGVGPDVFAHRVRLPPHPNWSSQHNFPAALCQNAYFWNIHGCVVALSNNVA